MNDARGQILDTIARNKARRRRAELPMHTVPQRALLPRPQMIELFETMARKSAATVERLCSLSELPMAAQRYLHNLDAPQQTVYLNSPELAQLNWQAAPELKVSAGPQDYTGTLGIAQAFCGVAETGSLALKSEASVSTAAWFLPDVLIVALAAGRIYPCQEDCWSRLQEKPFARTVTFMTGPSRTGDIEQKIVIGAHGPRHVHIALYDKA